MCFPMFNSLDNEIRSTTTRIPCNTPAGTGSKCRLLYTDICKIYPVADSHNVQNLTPNFAIFDGMYCLIMAFSWYWSFTYAQSLSGTKNRQNSLFMKNSNERNLEAGSYAGCWMLQNKLLPIKHA